VTVDEECALWQTLTAPEGEVSGLFLQDDQRALYQLPIEQREVLLLVALEGLSYQEAATVQSVPIGTVMSRLARAREHMRALLSDEPVAKLSELRVIKKA
jgi:RNA polymerase sigma-70 factor (ECF subfamily)